LPGCQRLGVRLPAATPGRLHPVQPRPRPQDPPFALRPIFLQLLRTAIPEDAISLLGTLRALDTLVDQVRARLSAWVRLPPYLPPVQRMVLQITTEPTGLQAGLRQHRQKPALSVGDVAQVLTRAQLAVG